MIKLTNLKTMMIIYHFVIDMTKIKEKENCCEFECIKVKKKNQGSVSRVIGELDRRGEMGSAISVDKIGETRIGEEGTRLERQGDQD